MKESIPKIVFERTPLCINTMYDYVLTLCINKTTKQSMNVTLNNVLGKKDVGQLTITNHFACYI